MLNKYLKYLQEDYMSFNHIIRTLNNKLSQLKKQRKKETKIRCSRGKNYKEKTLCMIKEDAVTYNIMAVYIKQNIHQCKIKELTSQGQDKKCLAFFYKMEKKYKDAAAKKQILYNKGKK